MRRPHPHLTLIQSPSITSERKHDLPPMWDGHPVRWGAWSREPAARMCALDASGQAEATQTACTECGTVQTVDLIARGRVLSSLRGTSGQLCEGALLTTLIADRCEHCGHDTVHRLDTRESWDLTPSDYTDTGSWVES